MALERILKDGTETGGTGADKINLAMDAIENIGDLQVAFGTDIDGLIINGVYEVDTGLPFSIPYGEISVQNLSGVDRVIQMLIDGESPLSYYRERVASVWSAWHHTNQSDFNDQTGKLLNEKADKAYVDNAMINTYGGTSVPSPSLGKSGDTYHKYVTATSSVIKSGMATEGYNSYLIDLFYDDTETVGLYNIAIKPDEGKVYISWIDASPHSDNYSLKLDGTTIPLTIDTNTQLTVVATYDAGYDATILAITTATNYELSTDILSGVETDYTKYGGTWLETPMFSHTYDFIKTGIPDTGSPIVISTTTYTNIATLLTPPRDAGVYEIKFSQTFSYDSTQRSAYFQWSLNGGINWEEFRIEPKDASDMRAMTYEFPFNHGGGTMDIKLHGKCENGNDTLSIGYANIILERKK